MVKLSPILVVKQKVRDPQLKRKGLLFRFHSKRFFVHNTILLYLNHLVTVERLQVAPFPTVHGADELKRGLVTEEEEPPECRICGGGTEAEGR